MTHVEQRLKAGQVIRNFPTNTIIYGKVKLEKLLHTNQVRDVDTDKVEFHEYWTVLIDDKHRAELWIRVDYNPTVSDNRTRAEKGWNS